MIVLRTNMAIGPFWCVHKDAWLRFEKDAQGKFYAEMAYRDLEDSTRTTDWKEAPGIDFWTVLKENSNYPKGEGIRLLDGVVYRTAYMKDLLGQMNVYFYDSSGEPIRFTPPRGTSPAKHLKPFDTYPLNCDNQELEQSTKQNSIPSVPKDCANSKKAEEEEEIFESKEEPAHNYESDPVRPPDLQVVEQLIPDDQPINFAEEEELATAMATQASFDQIQKDKTRILEQEEKTIQQPTETVIQSTPQSQNFNLNCYIALAAASAIIALIGIIIAYASANSEVSAFGDMLGITGGVTSALALCGLFKPRIDDFFKSDADSPAPEFKS